MKSLTTLAVLLSTVCFSLACSHKSTPQTAAPSIRADFKDKYDFVMATLKTTQGQAQAGSISGESYQLLSVSLSDLKEVIPARGLSENKTLDNLNVDESQWQFDSAQPVVRIDQIYVWAICSYAMPLPNGDFSIGNLTMSIGPSANAYPWRSTVFEYDNHPAQYFGRPRTIVTLPADIHIDLTLNGDCHRPRKLLLYSQFPKATLVALDRWKTSISEIEQDLQGLSQSSNPANYPVNFVLENIAQKLAAAYNALP